MTIQKNLKNADKLLADIITGLKPLADRKMSCPLPCIEVKFFHGPRLVRTQDLIGALDAISNDLFFDEDGDFSEADRATVDTI
jgi:hypothetical protein